jgi:hypothetical protein
MISQLFILSARGDTIINRDFRSDLIKNTPELFFRNVKLHNGDAPPLFNLEGINFAYLKKACKLLLTQLFLSWRLAASMYLPPICWSSSIEYTSSLRTFWVL